MNNSYYRKLYESYYETTIPKGWEVHHIDYNHDNNSPENLVALPKELHNNLHKAYSEYKRYKDLCMFSLDGLSLISGLSANKLEFIYSLFRYVHFIIQCIPYMNKRDLKENIL